MWSRVCIKAYLLFFRRKRIDKKLKEYSEDKVLKKKEEEFQKNISKRYFCQEKKKYEKPLPY
jgi:hypothetical protein